MKGAPFSYCESEQVPKVAQLMQSHMLCLVDAALYLLLSFFNCHAGPVICCPLLLFAFLGLLSSFLAVLCTCLWAQLVDKKM